MMFKRLRAFVRDLCKTQKTKATILVDREGVAYRPTRRVVLKAGARSHG